MLYGSRRGVSRRCMRRVSVSYLTTPIFHTNAGEDQEGEVAMPPRRSSLDHGGSRHARATRLKKLRRRDSLGQNRHIKRPTLREGLLGRENGCNLLRQSAAALQGCNSRPRRWHRANLWPNRQQIHPKANSGGMLVLQRSQNRNDGLHHPTSPLLSAK